MDVVDICVPTPLRKTKDPDVSYILAAVREIAPRMKRGQLIVLESTTYPGTTDSWCFRCSSASFRSPQITYMPSLTTATFSLELFMRGSSLSAYVLLICTYKCQKKSPARPANFPNYIGQRYSIKSILELSWSIFRTDDRHP